MNNPNWCLACDVAVNFSNQSQSVAHYRSKKHRTAMTAKSLEPSDSEQQILNLTNEEALAITRPGTGAPKEIIPLQLFAHGIDGRKYRIYSDIIGNVSGK
jgi:hypothetical protein